MDRTKDVNNTAQKQPHMAVEFCGVTFQNPIIAASTDMSRTEAGFEALLKSGVGGIITKSVTDAAALQAKSIARFDIRDAEQNPVQGKIPSMYTFFSRGGSMVGMDVFRTYGPEQLKRAREEGVVLIGSISASKKSNWIAYAVEMERMGFPMLELNFGNPHGEAADGKLGFLLGQDKELCREIVSAVLEAVKIPVIVKLTPQVSDLTEIAASLAEIGVQAVTVMHRYQGLIIDVETEMPAIGGFAAIGGPWMKPIALANIAKIYRGVKGLSVCGGNGVDTGKDAAEYMMSGASAVQIGSGLMLRGPEAAQRIVDELADIVRAKGLASVSELTGRAAERIVTYKSLGQLPVREPQMDEEKCGDCDDKICLRRCYFGALREDAAGIYRDGEKCTGCGMCRHVCHKGAVRLVEKPQE